MDVVSTRVSDSVLLVVLDCAATEIVASVAIMAASKHLILFSRIWNLLMRGWDSEYRTRYHSAGARIDYWQLA
jgi:hypothetical protein